MSKMLNRWMSALRDLLHLSAIERDIADSKRDIADSKRDIVEIRKAMEDRELRTGAGQALLANQQQYLEIMINELDKSMREMSALITDGRTRKDEVDLKFAGSIAQLSNEIKQLCKVVDEHVRSTTLK